MIEIIPLEKRIFILEKLLTFKTDKINYITLQKLTNSACSQAFNYTEILALWDEFDGQITYMKARDFIHSFKLLGKVDIPTEMIKLCYLEMLDRMLFCNETASVEYSLCKIIEKKYKNLKRCRSELMYKYIFWEYCRHKPENKTYTSGWGIPKNKSIQYLAEAIKELS